MQWAQLEYIRTKPVMETPSKPLIPSNEPLRLAALDSYDILDTPPEPEFEKIIQLICMILNMPMGFISFIDKDRIWYKSKLGFDYDELPRNESFSQHTILQDDVLEILDASNDERVKSIRFVTGDLQVKYYAGVPLITDEGFRIGTISVMDTKTNSLSNETKVMLEKIAQYIITQLELRKKNIASKQEVKKQADQEIKELQLELTSHQKALDESSIVMIVNKDGIIQYANETACRYSKYSQKELINQNISILRSGYHTDEYFNSLWSILNKGQVWKGELRNKAKDGTFYWVDMVVVPFMNEKGELVKYVSLSRDITDKKFIFEENQRLSFVARGIQDGVLITDPEGVIQWINHPYELISEYSLQEVMGKKMSETISTTITNPEFINQVRSELFKTFTYQGEIKNITKSGREYYLNVNIQPIYNEYNQLIHFVAFAADITEKKQKEIQILALIEDQKATFDGVGLSIIHTDINGIIQRVNPAALELLEYTAEELVGKMDCSPFYDVKEMEERTKELSLELGYTIKLGMETVVIKSKLSGKPHSSEWTYVTKSGNKIPVWLTVTCIKNEQGEITGYIRVAENYTTKKEAEKELLHAKLMAEEAVLAKDSFLANMSHEIRTPLNAIIGFTELLSQSKLDPIQTEYLSNIHIAGDNLLLIINDILDLSKIESGKLEIESYPFNLTEILRHVHHLLKVKAEEKKLDFSLYLDADLPEMIEGDRGRLNQILMNLAGNAIKFTHEGDVSIQVKKLEETSTNVTLRFSVKDTGIGMSEEVLERIFERFTQAESSTTRKFGGTGLGLSISKQLVELQHGEIHVKSKQGIGSEFYFILTYKKSNHVENKQNTDLNRLGSKKRQVRILLCEDNVMNQKLAEMVIKHFGFDIKIANHGQMGIELVKKENFDLILMDLQMPIMDGYQATSIIRKNLNNSIPIIAMTAHSLVGEKQKCLEIGMNGYISKPFKQSELLNEINRVLSTSTHSNLDN